MASPSARLCVSGRASSSPAAGTSASTDRTSDGAEAWWRSLTGSRDARRATSSATGTHPPLNFFATGTDAMAAVGRPGAGPGRPRTRGRHRHRRRDRGIRPASSPATSAPRGTRFASRGGRSRRSRATCSGRSRTTSQPCRSPRPASSHRSSPVVRWPSPPSSSSRTFSAYAGSTTRPTRGGGTDARRRPRVVSS